jgi:hypothetical protein
MSANPDIFPRPLGDAPPWAYCFSLSIKVQQQLVGQVLGGYRIDLEYPGGEGSVTFGTYGNSALARSTSARLSVKPKILSGNDWIFMSKGGQVDFDSRVTLQFGDGFDALTPLCPLEARIRGRTNLRACQSKGTYFFGGDARKAAETPDVTVSTRWQQGLGEDCSIPLLMAVSFDVPIAGLEDGQTEAYNDCRELERSLFFATGRALLGKGPQSPVQELTLDLYRADMSRMPFPPDNRPGSV